MAQLSKQGWWLTLLPVLALAASDPIAALLAQEATPPGVVFEIASRQDDALQWAVPRLRHYTARLRQRFPDLPVAVVSHGREQFALLADAAAELRPLHTQLRSLSEEDSVSIHVCGVNAERRVKAAEDFAAFVDVAPEGPAQIHNYEALGYVRIRLRRQD